MSAENILHFLIKNGLGRAGALGLMGNLYAESGLISNRVETLCLKRLKEAGKIYTDATYTAFVDDGTISKEEFLHPLPNKQYGYGLAQWTSPGRKAGLYDYCKAKGVSIGDEQAQLEYLMKELKESYSSVLKVLLTTIDIKQASDTVLCKFEMPSDTSDKVKEKRYEYSKKYLSIPVDANMAINLAEFYVGTKEGYAIHKRIVDIYNSYKPWARGYKMQYDKPWCDTFVSTIFILLLSVDMIGGTECGVYDHVKLFKKAKIWKGKTKPQYGDIIVFDWQGDGAEDHIGFVKSIDGDMITTIEGNYKDSVTYRTIKWNDPQIAGYARPKYGVSEEKQEEPKEDNVKQVTASNPADYFNRWLAGTYKPTTDLYMRDGAGTQYKALCVVPKGANVYCYGYYSRAGSKQWLYVQSKVNDKIYTGFCSSTYLKKS